MQLGGLNIRELKKERREDAFTIPTSLWIVKKMVAALKVIHENGWVHR